MVPKRSSLPSEVISAFRVLYDNTHARRRVSEGLSRIGVKGESSGGEVQPNTEESDIKEEGFADMNPNQTGHSNIRQPESQPRPGPSQSPPAGCSSNEHPEVRVWVICLYLLKPLSTELDSLQHRPDLQTGPILILRVKCKVR
jgi:hypothetical protein